MTRIFLALCLNLLPSALHHYLLLVQGWDSGNKSKLQEKARTGNHYGVNLYTQKSTASQIVLSDINAVSEEKKQVIMNLYLSGIGEEFIAMQLDLEIPTVISILKALDVYGKSEAGLT